MSKIALSLAGVALVASAALAGTGDTLVLGTFDTPAADSVAVKTLYSASSFSNTASKRSLAVSAGALTLTTTLAMEGSALYSANAGILVPLNNLWAPMDIREATAISFRIWGNQAYKVNFALGSDIYPNSNDGVVKVKGLSVTTSPTLTTVVLAPVPEIEYLDWMIDEVKYPGGTDPVYITDPTDPDYASELNVATGVKQVQFNIDPTWGTGGKSVSKPTGSTTLSVDDIKVIGLSPYPIVNGISCSKPGTPKYVFSDMTGASGDQNMLGGYWYAFSDTGAAGPAKGASKVVLPGVSKKWHVDTTLMAATLVADLHKTVAGTYNKYSGFADIGTGMPDDGFVDLGTLEGFGFQLAIAPGATLDAAKLGGVHFKVQKASVGDSVTHEVVIPARQFNMDGGAYICVDNENLKMPAWFAKLTGTETPNPAFVPFTPEDVTKLGWELKIIDQSGKDSVALNQGIMVGPVTFYGISDVGVHTRAVRASAFSATYANSILSVKGLEGYKTVDVLSLSGARVASFKVGSVSKIRLDRGAYMLVARGEGKKTLARTLAVAK